jgi:hypothetical protein
VHFQKGGLHLRSVAVRWAIPHLASSVIRGRNTGLEQTRSTGWTFVAGLCSLHKLPNTLTNCPWRESCGT